MGKRYVGALVLRVAVLLLLSLACGAASAQAPPAQPSARLSRALAAARQGSSGTWREPGRLARVSAIAGVAGAGLMLSGTLAIQRVDRPGSEDVTRSIHLGLTVMAAPLVAWGSYAVRKREGVEGSPAMRALGWGFYASAIGLGVGQVFDAVNERPIQPRFGYLYGVLALLSLLPHCLDAFLTARGARVPQLLVTPFGVAAPF